VHADPHGTDPRPKFATVIRRYATSAEWVITGPMGINARVLRRGDARCDAAAVKRRAVAHSESPCHPAGASQGTSTSEPFLSEHDPSLKAALP